MTPDVGVDRKPLTGRYFMYARHRPLSTIIAIVVFLLQEGGAIYNEGDMKFLKRSPVYFGENESVKNGGSVYNKGSFVIRNESLFTESRSGGSGGAIFNLSPGTMK